MKSEPNFCIAPVDWQKEIPALGQLVPKSNEAVKETDQLTLTTFCEVAVHAWRAERRMKDRLTDEVTTEHKATYRSITGILDSLKGIGLELRDREGEPYDYGLPEKVVAAEKRTGISREMVAETIRPSLFLNGQLLRAGEIVIAVPESVDSPSSPPVT